ncbi:hypothetical protein [Crenobacter caeni]|uniref:Uncharacterized protein n=1 Tax=Crenobacter caeni TaxID=2705474 RepID=A0A6B2KVC8_9NEIS|nr:hypothetical protein [Crenobacter caeni]NDV13953.1 hypothetical protein [Crenobacter caeni]
MIDFILKNKEWLFSGVGVSAILVIGGWLFKRSRSEPISTQPNPTSAVRVEVVQTQPLPAKNIQPNSEVASIVKRFNQVLDLLNEKRTYGKYTIAGLAQLMKLHSVGELECVFLGNKEPSFEFIDHFCATFGVNRNWLIEGKEAPFRESGGTHFDPLDYLDEIEALAPNRLYFIRSASEAGEVFLLLKLSDYKYKIVSRVWHISAHVGAGGQSQIFGMYRLILALQKSRLSTSCGGRILPEDKFNDLLSGEVFPGSVIDFPAQENPWWDDFVDVHHKYPISSSYEAWYGKGFMAAQSIVRWKLKENTERQSANNLLNSDAPSSGAPVS